MDSRRLLRRAAAPLPQLGAGDVHLWRVAIGREAADLVGLLDEAERRSAAAFRFDLDRDRYVVSRGVVRALLGRYLDRDPRQLRFYRGPHQKPALVPLGPAGPIQFNVAHSGDVALVVISSDRAVGVDVEQIRTDLPIEQLARQAFSPRELTTLLSLSGAQRVRAFFACWTRKEAYLKARGTGLARDLKEFDVTLAPGEPASLLADRTEPAETARWSLRELPVGGVCGRSRRRGNRLATLGLAVARLGKLGESLDAARDAKALNSQAIKIAEENRNIAKDSLQPAREAFEESRRGAAESNQRAREALDSPWSPTA